MAGATIDHLVSVAVFIAALLLFVGLFMQTLYTAISYQRNRQVAVKASQLLDGILLNPGYPQDWGQGNVTPTSFGLQDPNIGGYVLSSFSLMRLCSSSGQLVYVEKWGRWYSNVSMATGGYLLVSLRSVVNYTDALKLLGINGSYGFQLTFTPILTISITEVRAGPLQIKVQVNGPGAPLGKAFIAYNLVHAIRNQGSFPSFEIKNGSTHTDSTGVAILNFPTINSQDSYALIVNARLCGLFGIGYKTRINDDSGVIVPFVENFEEGIIHLVHSWDVHKIPNPHALHYNATFLGLSSDFEFYPVPLGSGTVTGIINYGDNPSENELVQIPTASPGILVVTFRHGNEYGISMVPWGIGSLGVSLVFGDSPEGRDWVATDIRQVLIADVSYQAKIALWSLEGYQGWSRK